MSNPKHIVVFTSREKAPEFPEASKLEWANAYYYVQPRDKADAVYAPNHPKIEDEYIKAGKVAWRPSEEFVGASKEPEMEPDTRVEPSEVETPDEYRHWSELSWPKMRSLATQFTDEPVKSKDQAKEILEQAQSEGKL